MQYKNILITGGAGFIGSHLVNLMVDKYPQTRIINLDSITYAADISRVNVSRDKANYVFIKDDIRNENRVNEIFAEYSIDGVMHLAAESHVDNSIYGPKIFMETNIIGTHNLLSSARKLWQKEISELRPGFEHAKFLHVSTDEVYGSLGAEGYFSEETPYSPSSPYSSSKASSDMIAMSYYHTYQFPLVITNCSNNYGPCQHDEKLIPTVIRKALNNQSIPIYGNGSNIRDWLYVVDHATSLDLVFEKARIGEKYNIGTNNEKNNLELAKLICQHLDDMIPEKRSNAINSYVDLISFTKDRAGHDFRYAINNTKIKSELGWSPKYSFEESLKATIEWYIRLYLG